MVPSKSARVSALNKFDLDLAFRALSSPVRREILRIVAEQASADPKTCCAPGEVCACRFSELLGLSASTISHHTSSLVSAGLLTARKEGTWVYYQLNRANMARVASVISDL